MKKYLILFNTLLPKKLQFVESLSNEEVSFVASSFDGIEIYLSDKVSIFVNSIDIKDYNSIYFKSWRTRKNSEIASTAAHYLNKEGIKFFDEELVNNLSGGKLLQNMILDINKIPIVTTIFFSTLNNQSVENIDQKIANYLSYPFIVKPTKSRRGEGFVLIRNKDELLNFIKNVKASTNYIFQEYIEHKSIYRVLVFNYKAIFCQERYVGDNLISVSGETKEVNLPLDTLSTVVVEMCENAAHLFKRNIAGVDIIQDSKGSFRVLEVNPAPGIMDDTLNFPEFRDLLRENFMKATSSL